MPELDGLRALAAISVMVAHFNHGTLTPSAQSVYAMVVGLQRYSVANIAVAFFYVLSAFLLTFLASRELQHTGKFDRWAFLRRRIFRVWPLYFLLVSINYLLVWPALPFTDWFGYNPATWPWMSEHVWVYLAFLGNWSQVLTNIRIQIEYSTPGLGVLWSIAVEEQFYLLFALTAATALLTGRRLLTAIGIACLLGLLWRAWFLFTVPPENQPINGLYFASPTYLDMFAAGGAAGWVYSRQTRARHWLERAMRFPLTGLLILAGSYVLFDRWGSAFNCAWCPIWMYSAAALLMSASIAWVLVNRRSIPSRIVASWPFRTLGALSYGMYVWHPIVLAFALYNAGTLTLLNQQEIDATVLVTFLLYIFGTLTMASITYICVEQPFLALKDRSRRPTSAPRERYTLVGVGVAGGIGLAGVLIASLAFQVLLGAGTQDRLAAYLPVTWAQEPLPDSVKTAVFVQAGRPVAGGEYVAASGRTRTLKENEVVLTNGAVFQVRPNNYAVRLVPQAGRIVQVSNLGAWSVSDRRVTGLDMRYVDGAWRPAVDLTEQAVRWRFDDPKQARTGFTVQYPAVFEAQGVGTAESFARLLPALNPPKPDGFNAQVLSGAPVTFLDGAPVTIVARVRTSAANFYANLSVYDYSSTDPQAPPEVTITRFTTTQDWTTYTLRAPRVSTPDPRDHWSLYVESVPLDGWVDIAELYAYVGVLP